MWVHHDVKMRDLAGILIECNLEIGRLPSVSHAML